MTAPRVAFVGTRGQPEEESPQSLCWLRLENHRSRIKIITPVFFKTRWNTLSGNDISPSSSRPTLNPPIRTCCVCVTGKQLGGHTALVLQFIQTQIAVYSGKPASLPPVKTSQSPSSEPCADPSENKHTILKFVKSIIIWKGDLCG